MKIILLLHLSFYLKFLGNTECLVKIGYRDLHGILFFFLNNIHIPFCFGNNTVFFLPQSTAVKENTTPPTLFFTKWDVADMGQLLLHIFKVFLPAVMQDVARFQHSLN